MEDTPRQNNEETSLEVQEKETDVVDKLTQLPPKMQRFIHLYTTGQYTYAKLAQLLEVHPNTITKWMRNSTVQEIIYEMQQATHEMVSHQLKNLTVQAMNRLGELINSPVDGVAMQAVKDVLDRGGHKTKNEIQVDKKVTTVEEKIRNLADETIDVEEVQDVEYEEVKKENENE